METNVQVQIRLNTEDVLITRDLQRRRRRARLNSAPNSFSLISVVERKRATFDVYPVLITTIKVAALVFIYFSNLVTSFLSDVRSLV